MKLLAELQKQVGGLGTLRRAWFTSFNLDIEFVETYVLPITLGAERPRNRLEYEQLQQELTEKHIDFRVFCDPRFLEANRIKRTCIPVHGVRPERTSQRFCEASLFHPKVIYLEDRDGKRVIGAGSANLTLSGWGRNLEAFHFREITTHGNYQEIRKFFEQLCRAADVSCTLSVRGKFHCENEKWKFVHSYQEKSFALQLLNGAQGSDLAVWSPYLPRDLAGFICRLQAAAGADGLRVHLVPDRIQGKYLRTEWSEELSRMTADGRLTFHDSPVERDRKSELCHAKLWKLSGKLAIGSWNFTGPGSNSLCDDEDEWSLDNNVEAGFIIDDRNDWRKACGKVLDVGAADCAPPDLLEMESLVVDRLPPFDLHVSFDWHAQAYSFDGEWLGDGSREGYSVRLPGVASSVTLRWNRSGKPAQPGPLRVDDGELLRDRIFRIYQDDCEIHRALVSELNARSRRAQSFNTLQDLLEALVHDDDPRSLIDLPFRAPLDTDTFADESPDTATESDEVPEAEMPERSAISYFRLFQSMLAYETKLSNLKKLEQLEHQVFFSPGCLLELVGKTREQHSGRDVFNWFLANEVLALCRTAHSQRRRLIRGAALREPAYKAVPKARWDDLEFVVPELPPGVSSEYCALVRKQSGYG